MTLGYADEQRGLAEMMASFLRSTPEHEVLGGLAELGLFGLGIKEECGGAGGGLVDLSVVAREVGRTVPAGPFAASAVLAASLAAAVDEDEAAEIFRRLVIGEEVGTATWPAQDPLTHPPTLCIHEGMVRGIARVPFPARAGTLIAPAVDAHGMVRLVAVDPAAGEVGEKPLDARGGVATVSFESTPATVLGSADGTIYEASIRVLTVFAAELVGIGEAVLATAVEYASAHFQFNRAIGSFQAVKQVLVEAYMALDAAIALVHRAAVAIDNGDIGANRLVAFAFTATSSAAALSARSAMRTVSGISSTRQQSALMLLHRAQARISHLDAAARPRGGHRR